MRLTKFTLAVGLVFGAVNAGATTLYLDSVDGVKDSAGNYVGPYTGRLDSTAYKIFCDDFDHHIGVPDSETVNVSTISNLTNTRFGSLASATTLYEEVFYLSSYLLTASNSDRADIQDAMWSFFASDAPNQSSTAVQAWETQARNNYAGKDYSSFRILTDSTDRLNDKQELFISVGGVLPPGLTRTPEPATWGMLLTGLSGLAWVRRRRNRA